MKSNVGGGYIFGYKESINGIRGEIAGDKRPRKGRSKREVETQTEVTSERKREGLNSQSEGPTSSGEGRPMK